MGRNRREMDISETDTNQSSTPAPHAEDSEVEGNSAIRVFCAVVPVSGD